jgi:hypothetical protein
MDTNLTTQRPASRCHHCDWSYEADDSEFPSQFVFDLEYQVRSGDVLLGRIQPQRVSISDLRGNPMFQHEFDDVERCQVTNWFNARLIRQRELIMDSIRSRIEEDRQARRESTWQTFADLTQERCLLMTKGQL